jgi:hypothetical protein
VNRDWNSPTAEEQHAHARENEHRRERPHHRPRRHQPPRPRPTLAGSIWAPQQLSGRRTIPAGTPARAARSLRAAAGSLARHSHGGGRRRARAVVRPGGGGGRSRRAGRTRPRVSRWRAGALRRWPGQITTDQEARMSVRHPTLHTRRLASRPRGRLAKHGPDDGRGEPPRPPPNIAGAGHSSKREPSGRSRSDAPRVARLRPPTPVDRLSCTARPGEGRQRG